MKVCEGKVTKSQLECFLEQLFGHSGRMIGSVTIRLDRNINREWKYFTGDSSKMLNNNN